MAKEKKTSVAATPNPKNSFERFNNWIIKNDTKIFRTLLVLCIFLTFISFNARISEAHDDALYLEGGWRYVNEFPSYFYTQNAPLYPMVLAIFIKLFGFKLLLFKLLSSIFNVLGFVFFYKALRGRVPGAIFLPVVIFQATNHLIIYYASMTFTEAFYFFLQGLFFFYAGRIIDVIQSEDVQVKSQLKEWLMFGLSMFLISTAKSSAIVVIPAVILYFVIYKNWKAMGVAVGSYLVFKIPYEILVRSIWRAQNQFKGQSKILLQKDPYDKSQGDEDLGGFVVRFLDNCNLSLSKRFYQLLGLREETSTDVFGFLTIITIALALIGFWLLWKHRNKFLVLLALFTGAQLVLSYLILQITWDQARITLVGMPVLLILIFYALYTFASSKRWPAVYLSITFLVIGSVLISSFKRGKENLPVIKRNLKGDKFYGYTPDWQNFLKCSEWCSENLGDSALVASRKAPMSFVYGNGKKFFPIYSVVYRDTATNQSIPDSALAYFKRNKVTHVMLASLRANPNHPDVGIINTVHHIFVPIMTKYPEKLRLVHTEGAFEQTELFEIVY